MGYVARMEKRLIIYRGLVGKPDHSNDQGVDGRIILKWIIEKYIGRVWTGLMWFRMGTICGLAGCCEHGNEPSYVIHTVHVVTVYHSTYALCDAPFIIYNNSYIFRLPEDGNLCRNT